ncbi:endolytic transglycosylase MltG [Propionicimonas sp.]|uniref:endolytic transglycosylase MltG n=1 Tax=Propionicimonas sp. TaxID=1955623 RepID=UPI0017E26590|nr:endolytic transglycosylase MltG [Propionicimonas sp.]MBU3977378.1 endolytic transglycosylase MltG [Actinomycetota bacterium]MBA3021302.1 endolytic transglycosylase MltG [Propionicimonas sp.]MBU3985888.1 endolytic transglycosylase MltG [Actinomycetota bacterium]MBU4008673.1 endolytic transglycosylase MltG [Actinomycetota bacterium]MBU4066177.1 endolytic transglycosylase MltG [Actinomycetota bacterium]
MSNPNPGEWRDPDSGQIDYKEVGYRARSAFAVILSFVVLLGGGWFVFSKAQAAWMDYRTAEDYLGDGVAAVVVVIPKGATSTKIAEILVQADVVKSAKAFNRAASANPNSKSIQAGKYNLKTQLPAATALNMLLDKANLVRTRMTLKEGKWIEQQTAVMAKASGVPEADFKAAYKDWKNLGLPKWAKNGLEGFLFPDTYELPDQPTASAVIKVATSQFEQVATGLDIEARAQKLKLTPYQALIAASIVEKEVFKADDRPKVARVIYNRVKAGMPLGMDSTIAYAVRKTGVMNLTDADLAVNSPYNTRKHKGLPPGPISNPGKAAIEAALNPADGDWIYFITVNPSTGETLFTADYNEFLAGKDKYLQWCQANDANHKVCYGK